MKKHSPISWQQSALAILFLAAMAVGLALYAILPARASSDQENRILAQFPDFSWEAVRSGDFMKDFESFANDQFAGRDMWVRLNAAFIRLTGRQENKGVYFGRDGYLMEKLDVRPEGVLERNAEKLAAMAQACGLPVYVAAAPTAANLLADKLPPYAPVADQDAYLAQLEGMLAGSGAQLLSLDTFRAHAGQGGYFRTDHHWNAQGAYWAYRDICQALGIVPHDWEEYQAETVSHSFYGTLYSKAGAWWVPADAIQRVSLPGQEAIMQHLMDDGTDHPLFWEENLAVKDQYTYYLGGNHALSVLENPQGNGRKLLLFKDSYAHILAPYLASHFSEVHLLDPRYYKGYVDRYAAENGITDIVVVMTASSLCQEPVNMILENKGA